MISSLIWKLLERFGVQGVQFILQIILARLLSPEHYGVLSLMIIFIALANVFIQQGFNTALVQNKEVEEDDYSSVFWVSLAIAAFLYIILFFTAPFIAVFFKAPDIIMPLRVLALMLFPGAVNSIQVAKVSREMDFKKIFTSNVAAVVVSGVAGIVVAYMGGGLWALVVQTMLNIIIACLVMFVTVKWTPKFVCNLKRIKMLFSFGWKLLVSGLIETLYQDLSSLVIGRKYTSGMLGYYNRGKHFPQFIINAINGAIQSVLLPAMSKKQDNEGQVKSIMRTSMSLSAYIIFPMMAGLAAVAKPLVCLLLTEKWLPCVPYLQIFCFSFAFWPMHTSNLQAINAMGRSDIFLKLEIIKKSYGVALLLVAVLCFDSPFIIAMTGMVTTLISCFVNAFPNKKLIGYSYIDQLKDVFPTFLMSAIMFLCVYAVGILKTNMVLTLLIQVITGLVVYLALSVILKPFPYRTIIEKLCRKKEC